MIKTILYLLTTGLIAALASCATPIKEEPFQGKPILEDFESGPG